MARESALTSVLVLLADQFRWDCIGAYGADVVQTPNLDRLAAEGTVYEAAYCTQPVCSPSRASLLTGRYPHQHGLTSNNMALDPGAATIGDIAHAAGYRCGYVGKWHLGAELQAQHGFTDRWVSIEDIYGSGAERGRFSSYHDYLVSQGFPPDTGNGANRTFSRAAAARLPEEHGKPAFVAREASQFLEQVGDAPFLLVASFLEPHMPFFGPFDDMYDPAQVRLPESFAAEMDALVPDRYRVKRDAYQRENRHLREYRAAPWGPGGTDPNDELGWRRVVARYWGLCTLVDKYIGRVLDALAAHGRSGDTLVVFTSDHGEMLGAHRLLGKSVQHEPSIRVPLIIRAPGHPPKRVREPVSQAALAPTLLTVVGLDVPPETASAGLLPPWGSAPDPGTAVVEWNGPLQLGGSTPADPGATRPDQPARTVVAGRWKLTLYDSGEVELFDLDADPGELHNLAADPTLAAERRRLVGALRRWQERTGDHFAVADTQV